MLAQTINNKSLQPKKLYGALDQTPPEAEKNSYAKYKVERQNQTKVYWGGYKTYLYYNEKPLIVIGPHWICFVLGYTVFWLFSIYLVKFEFYVNDITNKVFHLSLFIILVQVCSYLLVSLKNPGIANQNLVDLLDEEDFQKLPKRSKQDTIWYCETCKLIQPPKTAHCNFCQICIHDFDHHCPWTGKCIGGNNFFEFILFVGSTGLLLVFFIFVAIDKDKLDELQQLSKQR